jgi:glutamyl-tRNA reductase
MGILVVRGLTHHSSPIGVRETIAMPKECLLPALQFLHKQPGITEAAIVSTCNRTECYVIADSATAGLTAIDRFLDHAGGVHSATIRANLTLLHEDAALHLFRVASGLDSLLFGETQISGQVRQSLEIARNAGTSGPQLNKLFMTALECAKAVRARTGIARQTTSIAAVAVEILRSGKQKVQRVLILGAGEIGRLCINQLLASKRQQLDKVHLTVLNRSEDALEAIKDSVSAIAQVDTSTDFSCLKELCRRSDVIFVTTSAPEFIVDIEHVRDNPETLVFDLSVPRNVNPEVAFLPGVKLFTVDDLRTVAEEHCQKQRAVIERAEPILISALKQYNGFLHRKDSGPAIVSLHNQVQSIRQRVLARAKLTMSAADYARFDQLSWKLVREILHAPTIELRGSSNSAKLVADLFPIKRDVHEQLDCAHYSLRSGSV